MFGSIGAVLFTALSSALIWNLCFIPPKFTFFISQADDIILCISYFVVAITSGFLTNRIRFHEKLMYERQERTDALYESLKDIANSTNKEEVIEKVKNRIGKLLDGQCGVIIKGFDGTLDFNLYKEHSLKLEDNEKAVASWTFQNQKTAGWTTDTLMQAKALYLPLKGASESIGVFVFKPTRTNRKLDLDQENLLYSITGQLGLSIERNLLSLRIAEAQRLEDSEKLHQTILNSISHELRTPLTVILGASASLESNLITDPNIKNLAESIAINGERLNRVIENLLDMSRLSSGSLALKLEWHDLSDLIGVVRRKLAKPLSNYKLVVKIAPEFQLIRIDFRLFEHAISNLILNSIQYSELGTIIYIEAYVKNNHVYIEVKDEGPGVPKESQARLFEKFYRVPGSPPGGTGLGLSIVQNIVELHKASIHYENNLPKGAKFIIDLPSEKQPVMPEEFKK